MERNMILTRANVRRAKGQTAAIVVLILIAAAMLNLWLMLALDYKANFVRCHDRLNAEDVMLALGVGGDEAEEFLAQTLEHDARTDEYYMDNVRYMPGSFPYNGGDITTPLIFLEKEAACARPVGRVEIVEESGQGEGIYMPILYKSDDIAVGKTVTLSIGDHPATYTVRGFFNSVMAGSHNCAMCEILLTKDCYDDLKESGYALDATLVSVRLKDRGDCEKYEAELKSAASEHFSGAQAAGNSYALIAQSRYISQMICAGIISAMAFFVLLIALVVIASNIINYIQENMKNLGALKALGYVGAQMIAALLFQFAGIALIVAAAGAGLSYLLFPSINAMMNAQVGIPYEIHFLPLPFVLTVAVVGAAVSLCVFLSARRMKRVEPIVALRQGTRTHSFRKNHVPLAQTKAPVHLALALKTTLSGIKQNVTVAVTMLVLSLVVVFSGLMLENVIFDITPFLDMIAGEVTDSCINVNAEAEEAFVREMEGDSRVEKAYLYHSQSSEVRHVDGVALAAIISDDFADVNNQSVVFEGRFPKYDNEVAVAAKYAREENLGIGDEIALTADGREARYLISGFTQISNNLGKDCLLTRAGYERMGELANVSYYLNLADGTDVEAFNEEMGERFAGDVNMTINVEAVVSGTVSVYVALMTMIVVAVLALSAVVIAFVLYLLVRTLIGNKKRDYGILKALGYTTGQLVLQTALSFMPAVVVFTVVGMLVCSAIINPLTALFLNGIGIVKCTFRIPVLFNVLAGAGLVAFAFAAACLMSLRIRKIAPRALLAEE